MIFFLIPVYNEASNLNNLNRELTHHQKKRSARLSCLAMKSTHDKDC